MHICILNEFFYPDKTGGTPQKLSELSTKIRERYNDEVTVVTSSNSYRNLKVKYSPFETWNGIKIHRVDGPHWSDKNIAQRLLGNIVFTKRACRFALRHVSCDLLLVSSAPPVLPMAAQVYHKQHGVPYVYYVADLDPDRAVAIGAVRPNSLPVRLLAKHQRLWLHGAYKVVVLGRCMRDVIVGRYGVPQDRVRRFLPIPATFQQPKLNAAASAGSGAGTADAAQTAALLSARLQPSGPALPLSLGFAGALPLTWLQRRVRIRIARRRETGPRRARPSRVLARRRETGRDPSGPGPHRAAAGRATGRDPGDPGRGRHPA